MAHIGYSTLARILEARREETLRDLKQRLQDAREEWTWTNVRDTADSSELEGREGLELGLIRLKVDTLQRINLALARLRHGTYGHCVDCRRTISEPRLRALPFAVRCRECEEARERAEQSARVVAARARPPSVVRHSMRDLVEAEDWSCGRIGPRQGVGYADGPR